MAFLPLTALLGQMDRPDGSAGLPAAPADPDALAEVARQAGISQQNAAAAFQQLMSATNAPPPVVNPIAKFGANLAGNISQAISPQMGGQEAANNTIQGAQDLLNKQHIVRLTMLANNYDKQAELARQQGNLVLEGKLASQAAKIHGQLQERLQAEQLTSEEKRAALERQTQLGVAGIQQQTALGVENMKAKTALLNDRINKGWVEPDNPEDKADPFKWTPPDGLMSVGDYQRQKGQIVSVLRPMAGKPMDPASGDRAAAESKNLALNVILRNENPYGPPSNVQNMANRLMNEREPLARYPQIRAFDLSRITAGYSPLYHTYDVKRAPVAGPLLTPEEIVQRLMQVYQISPEQANTVLKKAGMNPQRASDAIRAMTGGASATTPTPGITAPYGNPK